MFDAINPSPALRRKQIVTFVGSMLAHAAIIALVILAPLLYFTEQLPKPPDMLAFVATSAPPPPPPPPPAAPQKAPAAKPKIAPQARPNAIAAPVEAPPKILPERLPEVPEQTFTSGGVEGGVIGGIAGGIVGGIPIMPAPPPPAAPPPKPVRVGGAIEQPALLYRVNPEYPPMAVSAKKEGMVILEATVDANGLVRDIRVLRSEPLLDKAAVEAVKQWRYSPLQLNGQAQPFILTVTVSFSL
jgi:periplasmic protein TonB